MAVVIRLRRAGTRKRPFYHMVVTDSRMRRDGRFIEIVGRYNPLTRPAEIEFAQDRVTDWIAKGAQPSVTVDRLIRRKQKGGVEAPSQKERKRRAQAAAKPARAAEPKAPASASASAASAPPAAEEPAAEPVSETPAE